jgi:hypothetical protein
LDTLAGMQSHVRGLVLVMVAVAAVSVCASLAQGGTSAHSGVTSTLAVEVAGPFSNASSAVAFYKAVRSNCGAVTGFAPNACLWTGAIARLKVRSWMLEQSSGV